MENLKDIFNRFQIENEKRQFAKLLAELYIHLRKKERRVFYHIGFRNMADDGFCYEFYKNIAKNTGVHRNTIPKYVNLFIENKLLEKTTKFAKYRYRRGLILTKLGLCFYIFIRELNIYLKNRFSNNNENNKEIRFFDFLYKYILSIFYLFSNILGSTHNQKHKETHKEVSEGIKSMDLGVREISKDKIYDKPPPNNMTDEERIWHLKRNQFIKCLNAGWNLPEEIMDKFDLWQYKK